MGTLNKGIWEINKKIIKGEKMSILIKEQALRWFLSIFLTGSMLLLPLQNAKAEFCTDEQYTRELLSELFTGESIKLLAIEEAAKDYVSEGDKPAIFKGEAEECSKSIAGIIKDCCGISANGFLEGKILSCEPEELEVARAKEAGRAVELGKYCRNKVLGVCISYHKTYCLFQSKLARIIQVAARNQLGISFGDPETPNCRALTQDEFQKIDFSKVDFSDFYKDIEEKAKQESQGSVTARAKEAAGVYKQ